jgi:DNA-binding transcriptional MerR regulator
LKVEVYRIGELPKQFGIATSKIRFLESRDLVYSSRLPNRHRDYDQESLLTLQTATATSRYVCPRPAG